MDPTSNVKGVKFIHMNTRSLYRKIDEIRLLYAKFDFICCSETWLDDRYTDTMLMIDSMKLFRLDRPPVTRGFYRFNNGGGVCIYVDPKWISYCSLYEPGIATCSDFEIITLKINKPCFKTFCVSSIYKPPKGDADKCIKFLNEIMSGNPNYEYWFLGDFNIDFLKRNVTSTKKIISSIRTLGLAQKINHVTRPAKGGGTCIDWILTNSDYVSLSYVSNNLISDHYPVVCVRKKAREFTSKEPRLIRLYSKLDFKVFDNILKRVDWTVFESSDDVNVMWDFIREKIREIIIVMCPLKRIFVRKRQPPWFDNLLYRLLRDRERLSRLFRNTGDTDVLREFKIVRNRVTEAVRKARSTYINLTLNRNKNDPRKFWRIIKSLYNNRETTEYDGGFIDPLNGLNVPVDTIAVFLNNYFATIGSRLYNLNDVILDDLEDLYPEMHGLSFVFPTVDRLDILMLAKEIDVHKSSCIPEIRSDLCKRVF